MDYRKYGITERQAEGIDLIGYEAYTQLQKEFYREREKEENAGRKFNGKINERTPSDIFRKRTTRALNDLLAKNEIGKNEEEYFLNEWLEKASHQQKMAGVALGIYNPELRPSTPTSTASDSDSSGGESDTESNWKAELSNSKRGRSFKAITNTPSPVSPVRKKRQLRRSTSYSSQENTVHITTGFDIEKFKFLTISN